MSEPECGVTFKEGNVVISCQEPYGHGGRHRGIAPSPHQYGARWAQAGEPELPADLSQAEREAMEAAAYQRKGDEHNHPVDCRPSDRFEAGWLAHRKWAEWVALAAREDTERRDPALAIVEGLLRVARNSVSESDAATDIEAAERFLARGGTKRQIQSVPWREVKCPACVGAGRFNNRVCMMCGGLPPKDIKTSDLWSHAWREKGREDTERRG